MGVGRTLLRPLAQLAGMHASGQARAFLAAHRRTEAVQQRLLAELLARHADTDFGRDHGFGRLQGYADFASAVPIRTYEQLRPYMDRVFEGRQDALLPADEEVVMFSQTSGTTGLPKHIPVTRRFLATMRRGWNIFGMLALNDHKEAWLRGILQISSSPRESLSPGGKPCGAISGLLASAQKKIVRRMYVAPPCVADIEDPAARYYAILRCGVGRDVAFITTANPSSTIKLIETGQAHAQRLVRDVADGTFNPPGESPPESVGRLKFRPNPRLARRLDEGVRRDGVLLPRHFWRIAFLCNWTGGTLKLYLRRLRELFDDAPVRDIGLLASEGRFSIPLADEVSAGVAEITDNILEFMPPDQADRPNPLAVPAHEAQVGQEYFLVVTNWAGLWRYNMDDRVRVIDKLGQSPVFEFLSRGLHTASITGEKLTEHQVVEAMRRAASQAGAAVERFVLQGCFGQTPYYQLRLETPDDAGAAKLAELMDAALAELNVEYRSKRSGGRLGPIRSLRLPQGAMEQAERQAILARRGRSDQYKHKYLLTDIVTDQ